MDKELIKLNVKMSEITLTPIALDNLVSEFYGVIPAIAGAENESDAVTIEFQNIIHPIIKETINGLECMNALQEALDSFKISKQ